MEKGPGPGAAAPGYSAMLRVAVSWGANQDFGSLQCDFKY